LSNAAENNLNLFGAKGYRPPMGDVTLQKRPDLARVTLSLPLFSKTSLVTSRVYSVAYLFNHPYAVRDCPDKPLTSYLYKCYKTPVKLVKTRRKSLVSNKVYLQMAGRACSQNSFSNMEDFGSPVAWRRRNAISKRTKPNIACLCDRQGLETCTWYITEVAQRRKTKPFYCHIFYRKEQTLAVAGHINQWKLF
jgi:hypothetical protein